MYKQWTKEQVATWPEGHKECRKCKNILSFENFSKHTRGKFGLNNSCKLCRKVIDSKRYNNRDKNQNKLVAAEAAIFYNAKGRAKRNNLEFTISIEDIVIPDICPALGIKIEKVPGSRESSPSLDRIDSSKGYTKDNICIISYRANRIKNNATVRELEYIIAYMKRNGV